jgi:hypothetical protein
MCGRSKDPKLGLSNSHDAAIIVFSVRTVKDPEKYKAAYNDYATKTQEAGKGIRALFSFMDQETPDSAFQFAWYDTPADMLSALSAAGSLSSLYKGTPETDFAIVWGGWDDAVKTATDALAGVKYSYVKEHAGFIRADGEGYGFADEPPMIWISKRKTKPGIVQEYLQQWQKAVDMQFKVAPGLIATCERTADDLPDHVWSVRIFTDYKKGFYNHAIGAFPFLLFQLMWHTLPKLAPPFPLGIAFCLQKHLDGAISTNPGNKSYKGYNWENVIGPMPNFAKGK